MARRNEKSSSLRSIPREGITIGDYHITAGNIWGWVSALPVLFLYSLIVIVPIIFAFVASLHEIPLTSREWTYVGLENYYDILQIDQFWDSMWRGVVFMVGSTVVQSIVGIWMALVINRSMKGTKLLSAVVFTAYLVPTIVLVFVARFMLDPFSGLLHKTGTGLDLWSGHALSSEAWAMPLLILIGSWKFAAFITLFSLAQLRSIPSQYYDAAKMAGATRWEMFRDVTWPRIRSAVLIAILLRALFMFNTYGYIWQLTQGGPGFATTTLPVLGYRQAFQSNAYGMANALAVVMFLALFVGAYAYMRLLKPAQGQGGM